MTERDTRTEAPAEGVVSTALRRVILFGVFLTTAAGALGTAFLPYLLVEHPALLLLSSADGRNLVLVAPQLDPWIVMVIGVPRRVMSMLVTYGIALLYGRAMLAWSARKLPRITRALTAFERLFSRYRRMLLVVWPTYTTSGLAGVTRTELRVVVLWTVVGQFVYVAFMYTLGGAVSTWTDEAIAWLSRHVWESTAVCAALVVVQQVVSFLRRRSAAGAASTAAQ